MAAPPLPAGLCLAHSHARHRWGLLQGRERNTTPSITPPRLAVRKDGKSVYVLTFPVSLAAMCADEIRSGRDRRSLAALGGWASEK